MNFTDKFKKSISKVLLLLILFIAVIVFCEIFLCDIANVHNNPVAVAVNSPTLSLGTVVTFDTGKAYNASQEQATSPNPLAYSAMTGGNSGDITASVASNKLSIASTRNLHYEALYADLVATVNIPAWYEYEIEYTFNISFKKVSGSGRYAYYNFFDFQSDQTVGANANFNFRAGSSTTTSPNQYTVLTGQDLRDYASEPTTPSNITPYTNQYKVTYKYKNANSTVATETQNFGAFAVMQSTTGMLACVLYDVSMTATVKETKLSATKPTADTHVFKYNGSNQTYTPVENLADQSKYRLVTSTSDPTPNVKKEVGTYKVKYELVDPTNAPWDGGGIDPVEFDFIINKGDLEVILKYTGKGTQRFLSEGLPKETDVTVVDKSDGVTVIPGTFTWDSKAVSLSQTEYAWTFTPTDSKNWNIKRDKETISFKSATFDGIVAKVEPDPAANPVYDRPDLDDAAFLAYLKSRIHAYEKQTDGTVSTVPIADSDYSVSLNGGRTPITSSTTATQSVRVLHSSNKYVDISVPINKSEIIDVNVRAVTSPTPLVYPVTLNEIKNNYQMNVEWNFNRGTLTPVPADKVSVDVKNSADKDANGIVRAGNVDLTFTYSYGSSSTKTADVTGCSIAKGDYDLSGVTFDDSSVPYDGTKKTVAISGDIKDKKTGNVIASGVTVSYVYKKDGSQISTDGVIDVGTYDVVASFANSNPNYNDIPSTDIKTAKLTVTNKSWDMTGVTFTDDTLTYDGNFHTVAIGGAPLPDPNIQVTYKYEKGGVEVSAPNGIKDAGVYTVTASFSNPDPTNYADIPDMTATLTINKASYDMSGITFEDKTVTANGAEFTLKIDGTLPSGVSVSYSVDGQSVTSFKNAGTYVFTAMFTNPDPTNYNDIADMTATLTIEAGSEPTPELPPNNGTNLWDKIVQAVENGFPLWQIATIAAGGLLCIIFLIKSIQYGNRRKKAKGEAKKYSTKTAAALLPVFDSTLVLAGLSNKIWSIIAFAMVGVTVLMFLVAIITRKGWKKAEAAKEEAMAAVGYGPQGANMLMAANNNALDEMRRELKETLTQVRSGKDGEGESAFEKHLIEMEERHRKEMEALREEQRRENERREEEQAKRDEAMKLMLANMMGRQQGTDGMDMGYASMDNTDLLVQKVIAGLLPMVQQMVPEPTAYLAAPDGVDNDSINTLTSVLQQQNAQIAALQSKIDYMSQGRVEAELLPDNSEEIRALKEEHDAQIAELQRRIADLSQGRVEAELLPDQTEEINALNAKIEDLQHRLAYGNSINVASDQSEEIRNLTAQIEMMQSKMDMMSSMSVDELDDEDFDDEEEWDSILDEDEDDDFVEAIIIDEGGKERKVYPNFRMRLKQSSDKNREWYAVIKNLFCSQKGVTYRVYKRVEKIRYQGQVIAVIGIAKRSIKLWLALKPYEYDARRYHHKDVSDKPRFVDVPMYVRVGSDRALDRSQELILALFQELNMEARKRYTDRPIQELIFTLKHNRLLTNKQNKQLLCETMHVHDCDVLDDETAEKCIEFKNVESLDESNIETVKLDDIDAKFQDGNRVTLDRLKKVGLVSEDCTGFTVTADKRLTKPLIIVANDFTLTAVKLIVLTGGRTIKLQTV